jgi:hypothetical protein
MEAFCESMAQTLFGRGRDGKACVACGSDKVQPKDFRDALSLREYGISHMCQKCQNSVFDCGDE